MEPLKARLVYQAVPAEKPAVPTPSQASTATTAFGSIKQHKRQTVTIKLFGKRIEVQILVFIDIPPF